jgi:hypothetical protein
MKQRDPRSDKHFCHICGSETLLSDDAEPFFDSRTGKPHYYLVDERCPTHGQLHRFQGGMAVNRIGLITGLIVGAILLGMALLLVGCAPMQSADEVCTNRFGPAGPDYWACMSYTQAREQRIDSLMSELREANRPINPYAYMPPATNVYVHSY